jgi:hypothetical protein
MIMELTGVVERLADINTALENLAMIEFERTAVIPQGRGRSCLGAVMTPLSGGGYNGEISP